MSFLVDSGRFVDVAAATACDAFLFAQPLKEADVLLALTALAILFADIRRAILGFVCDRLVLNEGLGEVGRYLFYCLGMHASLAVSAATQEFFYGWVVVWFTLEFFHSRNIFYKEIIHPLRPLFTKDFLRMIWIKSSRKKNTFSLACIYQLASLDPRLSPLQFNHLKYHNSSRFSCTHPIVSMQRAQNEQDLQAMYGGGGESSGAQFGAQNDPEPWDLPLKAADQVCKECKRRKAKCNRALPTCSLCVKYKRHCLYEKHSRTPLTRKWVGILCAFLRDR